MAAQAVRTRAGIRGSSTRGLVATLCFLLAIPALAGWFTFDHLHRALVLDDRGVRVAAWVVDYHQYRGSERAVVRPFGPPNFETTLEDWPGTLGVGDTIDVVFDPQDPSLVVAADAPLVDLGVVAIAALDLLGVFLLVVALLPGVELARRSWSRLRGDRAPDNDRLLRLRPPLRHRSRTLAGLETGQVVLVLVVAPMAVTVLLGLVAADAARDAAALRTSGARTQAVVETSSWANGVGWLDVRLQLPDGTGALADIRSQHDVYYEGDTIEVIYEPAAPRNVQAASDTGWQAEARVLVGLFVACAVMSATTLLVAIVVIVQRARCGRTTPGRAVELPPA